MSATVCCCSAARVLVRDTLQLQTVSVLPTPVERHPDNNAAYRPDVEASAATDDGSSTNAPSMLGTHGDPNVLQYWFEPFDSHA